MRSAFVFDPGLIPLKLREGFNVIHVYCIPYLCGMPLPDRVRGAKDAFPKILLSLPFISRGNAFKAFAENFPRFAGCFDGFTLQNIGDLDLLSELIGKTPGVSRPALQDREL